MPSSEYLFNNFRLYRCNLAFKNTAIFTFKKISLPQKLLEYLSFVPIVIMSALWFSSLFEQRIGIYQASIFLIYSLHFLPF